VPSYSSLLVWGVAVGGVSPTWNVWTNPEVPNSGRVTTFTWIKINGEREFSRPFRATYTGRWFAVCGTGSRRQGCKEPVKLATLTLCLLP
jgi:hypothetical protein